MPDSEGDLLETAEPSELDSRGNTHHSMYYGRYSGMSCTPCSPQNPPNGQ